MGSVNTKKANGSSPTEIIGKTEPVCLGIYKITHIDVTSNLEYALVSFETGLVNLYLLKDNFSFTFIHQGQDHC